MRFESCEHLADANVDAVAEGNMSQALAANIESIGLIPLPGVAIGGGQEKQNFLAFGYLDTLDLDTSRRQKAASDQRNS